MQSSGAASESSIAPRAPGSIVAVPAPVLRLALGEMANVLLASQRVIPARLIEAGFAFAHPELDGALDALVGRR
jgi:NAD dependent epimerase/dehydratase family enzyme